MHDPPEASWTSLKQVKDANTKRDLQFGDMPHILILGTCDTKLDELLFLRNEIFTYDSDCRVTLVDAGRSKVEHEAITISQDVLTSKYAPENAQDLGRLARGDLIKYMIDCASRCVQDVYKKGISDTDHTLHAIIGAGGTGGTSLASAVMKRLPIGFPKLIVSTAASGDTGPIVGESDISLTYSVTDVAGLNRLLKRILSNAAGAISGMARVYERSLATAAEDSTERKRVGLTMFGVTTPCVDKVRQYLENSHNVECYVFHCTGHGGKALERLIEQGELDAVLDVTTTEICDFIAGGVMSAGENRLEAALKLGIPYIISLGATDMVNFGAPSSVPEKYQSRKLFEHNPTVTLMRTSPEECKAIGQFIVDKIQTFAKTKGNVQVVLPKGGVSMISGPGDPFYDADADAAIFSAVKDGLRDANVVVFEDDRAINDEGFATDISKRLLSLMGLEN